MRHALFILSVLVFSTPAAAQSTSPEQILYTAQTIDDMRSIQAAALKSDYALKQTAFMTNNIGPRLSGSAQAQRAVEYVADEMRKLGLEVRLQKIMVPHWIRGIETGELTQFPGMATGTTQKVVLTALGGSVATPPDGLTAEIVVVNDLTNWQSSDASVCRDGSSYSIQNSTGNWQRVVSEVRPMGRQCSTEAAAQWPLQD